jgi:DivIVA domain-containing protein
MEKTVSEPETPPEADVRFPIVLRGYDRRQVDEYVRVAEKRVDRHEKARRVAERRLAKAQVPAPRAPEPDDAAGLGRRIEKILQVAKAEAAEIKEQARKEAEELRAAAEKAVAETEAARAETERAAHRDAQMILSRAEEEAATIRATHRAVLAQLGQIAGVVEEVRDRFGTEAEAESPAEPEVADEVPSPA